MSPCEEGKLSRNLFRSLEVSTEHAPFAETIEKIAMPTVNLAVGTFVLKCLDRLSIASIHEPKGLFVSWLSSLYFAYMCLKEMVIINMINHVS